MDTCKTQSTASGNNTRMKKVFSVQINSTMPSGDNFFHCHPIQLIHSPIGNYLEAEATPLSRFGWRMPIEHPGKPHLLKVVYPDDRRRFMIVGDGSTYDANFGIVSGFRWPLSNSMQTAELYFWPRFSDFSLCFMTWGIDEPAAVSSVEIYELDDDVMQPMDVQVPGGRSFGISYEDPCGTQLSEGASTFQEWQDNLFTYLRFTGQNSLTYPICWYHGPSYPGTSEGGECLGSFVGEERKMYNVWDTSPCDWLAELLKRCEKENIAFWGEFTLLRLKSLMEKLTSRPDLLNALDNDTLQEGTRDWTYLYNTMNYPQVINRDQPTYSQTDIIYAYGEKLYYDGCIKAPIFNPLHPEVQESVIRFFRETCQCYREYSAFKGISLNFWAPTLLWFGSLRAGYDDYTIAMFEREKNMSIPVDPTDPKRYSARAKWLLDNCREEWVNWRCRKVFQLIQTIRDEMVKIRPDLVLSLVMWNEPYVPAICPGGTEDSQYGRRKSCEELYRDGGFDPGLYVDEANLELVYQSEGGNRDRSASAFTKNKTSFYMFRDFDYLDDSCWKHLRKTESAGVHIFNAWHEAWGEHKWYPADEPDVKELPLYGKMTKTFCRINSWYEEDGFWFDSQLRITPAFPPGRLYMEHLAHALASADARKITAGGLFVDKLHADIFREFSNIYCRLPNCKFEDVGSSGDPVTVRQLKREDSCCIYAVNREPYEVRVNWCSAEELHGSSLDGASQFDPNGVTLKPFELKAWNVNAPLTDFTCTVPEIVRVTLKEQVEMALTRDLPEFIARDLQQSLQNSCYSRLRHLLTSYPVHEE